ncbi:hypothetical protein FJT64_020563 [Amphibalanus amphitrite]|uniref:Uncharacterized protein n=1 Tax=Amphibalanus amphitrite TaxID=1232801 RepID=A0A6A4WWF1_AMPAM|nr:hypothetical protein FJT64_020563 [Amphibalanus amphitrite]
MASGQSSQGPWVQKSGRETSTCWSQLGSEARNKTMPPSTTSSGGRSSYSTTVSWGFSSSSKANGSKRQQDNKDKSGPGPLWF